MFENKIKIIKLRFRYCVNKNDDNNEHAQYFFKTFACFELLQYNIVFN